MPHARRGAPRTAADAGRGAAGVKGVRGDAGVEADAGRCNWAGHESGVNGLAGRAMDARLGGEPTEHATFSLPSAATRTAQVRVQRGWVARTPRAIQRSAFIERQIPYLANKARRRCKMVLNGRVRSKRGARNRDYSIVAVAGLASKRENIVEVGAWARVAHLCRLDALIDHVAEVHFGTAKEVIVAVLVLVKHLCQRARRNVV